MHKSAFFQPGKKQLRLRQLVSNADLIQQEEIHKIIRFWLKDVSFH